MGEEKSKERFWGMVTRDGVVNGRVMVVIYLGFCKALDTVPHKILLLMM